MRVAPSVSDPRIGPVRLRSAAAPVQHDESDQREHPDGHERHSRAHQAHRNKLTRHTRPHRREPECHPGSDGPECIDEKQEAWSRPSHQSLALPSFWRRREIVVVEPERHLLGHRVGTARLNHSPRMWRARFSSLLRHEAGTASGWGVYRASHSSYAGRENFVPVFLARVVSRHEAAGFALASRSNYRCARFYDESPTSPACQFPLESGHVPISAPASLRGARTVNASSIPCSRVIERPDDQARAKAWASSSARATASS